MAAVVAAALVLSGCGTSSSGNFFVTPGGFNLYKCDQLALQANINLAKEKRLRALREKAETAPAGGLISNIAYGAEYAGAQSTIDELRREATEKKCSNMPEGLMLGPRN